MALILRKVKGEKLSIAEMDGNLSYLESLAQQGGGGGGFPFTGDATIDGTLNIDFTDTLSFFTGDKVIQVREVYIEDVGWTPILYDIEVIGSILVNTDHEFYQFVGEGELAIAGLEFTAPSTSAGKILIVKTGSNAGSVLTNTLSYTNIDEASYGNQMRSDAVDVDTGERNSYSIHQRVSPSVSGMGISKTNDDEESVNFEISDTSTGFVIYNDLSDNEASLLRIHESDSGDPIFEVRNDGIFVGPNIPTADPLVLGQIWVDRGSQFHSVGGTLKVSAGI